MRRPAALVLVAFALLATPIPEAVAQAPPRPEPRELWRQFPLETGRSKPQTPAEESPPEVSVPTTGGTPDEGADGSVATVRTAAIVLAMALVLMLTTGGLAYAVRGKFDFGASRRRRRPAQSFREFLKAPVGAPPHPETERPERREPNAKRMVRGPGQPRRSAKRAAAVRARASITAQVEALSTKLHVDAARKRTESPTQDRIERLREKLNMYLASAKNAGTASDEAEGLKAKLEVHRAPAKSKSLPERLKEKLGAHVAAPKGVSTTHEELETLEAKLAEQAALADAGRETADEAALKEKLSGAGAAALERKVDHHAGTPSPKLDVSNRPAKDQPRASVADDALDTTLREPRGERAAAAPPAAPRPVSAATRRSTIAELLHEHGSDLAKIGLILVTLALVLLNIALGFGIRAVS